MISNGFHIKTPTSRKKRQFSQAGHVTDRQVGAGKERKKRNRSKPRQMTDVTQSNVRDRDHYVYFVHTKVFTSELESWKWANVTFTSFCSPESTLPQSRCTQHKQELNKMSHDAADWLIQGFPQTHKGSFELILCADIVRW